MNLRVGMINQLKTGFQKWNIAKFSWSIWENINGFCYGHYTVKFILCILLQVKAEDMDAYAPKDLLVVTTGSQVVEFQGVRTWKHVILNVTLLSTLV